MCGDRVEGEDYVEVRQFPLARWDPLKAGENGVESTIGNSFEEAVIQVCGEGVHPPNPPHDKPIFSIGRA